MKALRVRIFHCVTSASLGLLLVTCAPLNHVPRVDAPLPKLVLVPFTIDPEPVDGVLAAEDGTFSRLLAEEATSTARRALIERRVGSSVDLSSQKEVADTEALRVTGVVRVPVALPEELIGLRADQRPGPLVIANVRLINVDGTVIREAEGILTWRDARWLEGGSNRRKSRPVQTVLQEVVREAVNIAIRHLHSSSEHDKEDRGG